MRCAQYHEVDRLAGGAAVPELLVEPPLERVALQTLPLGVVPELALAIRQLLLLLRLCRHYTAVH